jgi:predicted DNA-binding transcriptional regulator YafY
MKTKYQRARYYIIDRELSRKNYVRTKDIVQIIKRELDINVVLRTIQKDIAQMQEDPPLGFGAPIKWDTTRKSYYYSEPFTIRAFGLKEEHINALLFYSKILNQYQEYKIFNDIGVAIEKVLDSFNIMPELKQLFKNKVIVQTEKILPVRGHQHIPLITQALEENKKLSFLYTPFGSKTTRRKLNPCLLREDKHMWYVLGHLDGRKDFRTFALDRISSLEILDEVFIPSNFNPDEHFKYSLGITVSEDKPLEIVLSFSPHQGNYLKALPIHDTQQVIVDNEDEYRVKITVIPTYELYSKILSYGNDVKVISPTSIVKEIKQRIAEIVQKYNPT